MLTEFDLIATFFTRPSRQNSRIGLGIGDDCALLSPSPSTQLAISSDMLVEGRHFFAGADPFMLGHKCLAVNLSDLAAMGAKPIAFTLALALPAARAEWLAPFSQGLFALADLHDCALIGGDTTKGPLTISITIFGELPLGRALRRDAAQVGDDIWVSGTLGDARLALASYRNEVTLNTTTLDAVAPRMHMPTPRVALGCALLQYAHAAIDISDGLIGDLGHIIERSQVGASINVDALPVSKVLQDQTLDIQRAFAGGDDYELCFTAEVSARKAIEAAAHAVKTSVTRIGTIESTLGLRLHDADGCPLNLPLSSFDHFTAP
jgi:thiamine-monophosphate kinase